MMKKLVLYWFRHDLRISDNVGLQQACRFAAEQDAVLLPVFCHTDAYGAICRVTTRWGFSRMSLHRQCFLKDALADLREQWRRFEFDLIEFDGDFAAQTHFFSHLAQHYELLGIFAEQIVAPEEMAQVARLRAMGKSVQLMWQSSMLDPAILDFSLEKMPDQFTAFRQKIESVDYPLRPVIEIDLSSLRGTHDAALLDFSVQLSRPQLSQPAHDARSSFPYWKAEFDGGSSAALKHTQHYFSVDLAHCYKQTRNQLFGQDFSTKFSPWLASGALSAQQIMSALRDFEQRRGKSDSSYWISFELLWRDYFRFLHHKYGAKLYRANGLSKQPVTLPPFDEKDFWRWANGQTGDSLVDAGMRELSATGYLSNRLRQQVASYWMHEMHGDWRVGAAWFESQLLDYDVYSNQGNWLYIAGRGTDPRGGRRFNPLMQAQQHDPDGVYRRFWSNK